jgi:geranylgeranyl diphosphate synthase, type III
VYFLAFQEILTLKAQGHTTNNLQGRLYSENDMDRIVTSQRTYSHPCTLTENLNPTAELLNLHRGQGLDLLWRDSLQCPTEEEYIAMVNDS